MGFGGRVVCLGERNLRAFEILFNGETVKLLYGRIIVLWFMKELVFKL